MKRIILSVAVIFLVMLCGRAETPILDSEYMLAEITADGVNLRSAPSSAAPIAMRPDYDWQGKPSGMVPMAQAWKGERIFVQDATPDWWRCRKIGDKDFVDFFVSKKFCKPVDTSLFEAFEFGKVYYQYETDEPEDDETGCWQPQATVTYIYPGTDVVVEQSTGGENLLKLGYIDHGIIHYAVFVPFRTEILEGEGSDIAADVSRDNGLVFRCHRSSMLGSRLPELKDFEDVYLMSFTKQHWGQIIRDCRKYDVGVFESEEFRTRDDLNHTPKIGLYFDDYAK